MTDFPRSDAPAGFFERAILFELGLAVLAATVGWALGHNPLPCRDVSGEFHRNGLALELVWGIAATVPLVAFLLVFDRLPWGPLRALRRLARDIIIPLFAGMPLWQLLLVSLAAGVGEETLFRGLVQGGLADSMQLPYRELAACLAASVLFGICHWLSTTYALAATLVGFYLGCIYLATGSLIPPVVAHGLYDFIALVYLVRWNGVQPVEFAAGKEN